MNYRQSLFSDRNWNIFTNMMKTERECAEWWLLHRLFQEIAYPIFLSRFFGSLHDMTMIDTIILFAVMNGKFLIETMPEASGDSSRWLRSPSDDTNGRQRGIRSGPPAGVPAAFTPISWPEGVASLNHRLLALLPSASFWYDVSCVAATTKGSKNRLLILGLEARSASKPTRLRR